MIEAGRPPAFIFNSSSEYFVQGAAFVEPRDDDSIGEAKRRVAHLASYVDALMALDPSAFEALCAGLLSALGVSNPTITARSRDEGVDFYGELRFDSILLRQDAFPTIHRQMKIWLVGQAKRYRTGQVSTPDLRQLVGSVELARAYALTEPSGSALSLRIRVCDPVACLFFTTGTISSAGWAMCKRAGIIAMDGSMIASFLAEREIGVKNGSVDNLQLGCWIDEFARLS
jgi:restriction endonuclease Mrr